MAFLDEVPDRNGNLRRLGSRPKPAGFKTAFRAYADAGPMFTRDQILGIVANPSRLRRRKLFGRDWILDQRQHGSCGGHMEAGAFMRASFLRGRPKRLASGAYCYSKCNGGSDDGSILEDEMKVGMQYGHARAELVTWDMIYTRQQPAGADADAAGHKSEEPFAVHTLEELQSALAAGLVCGVAVHVGDNFMRLDGNGVIGFDRGQGNHAVCVDDLEIVGGELVYDLPNSWGPDDFGVDGRGYLTDAHLLETIQYHQFYAVVTTREPDGAVPPPRA